MNIMGQGPFAKYVNWRQSLGVGHFFNRPSVAGAVLKSPQSLTHSLTHPLVKISSKHSQSQTGRARESRIFYRQVYPSATPKFSDFGYDKVKCIEKNHFFFF